MCVAVSPDGKWVVSGGEDEKLCLWNLEAATLVAGFHGLGHMLALPCNHEPHHSLAIVTSLIIPVCLAALARVRDDELRRLAAVEERIMDGVRRELVMVRQEAGGGGEGGGGGSKYGGQPSTPAR